VGGGGSGGDKLLYRSVAVLAKIEHTVRNQYNIRVVRKTVPLRA